MGAILNPWKQLSSRDTRGLTGTVKSAQKCDTSGKRPNHCMDNSRVPLSAKTLILLLSAKTLILFMNDAPARGATKHQLNQSLMRDCKIGCFAALDPDQINALGRDLGGKAESIRRAGTRDPHCELLSWRRPAQRDRRRAKRTELWMHLVKAARQSAQLTALGPAGQRPG
jgi:hypothetical protein